MGGLAIGAAAGGRTGQRLAPRTALRGYAALEAAIAAVALLLPWTLLAFRPLLAALYADGAGGLLFGGVRLAVSLLLLALPAAAMGATFPLASRWIVRSAGQIAVDAGRLYAANTLGAAVGAIVTGFVLLPAVGLTGATIVGVILNLTAAAGAWMLSRETGEIVAIESTPAPTRRNAKDQSPTPVGRPWLAAATLGVTGLASLTLQVVWTRLLASILGPTTYAFSAVVAIFILGIAGGSAAGARISRRTKSPVGMLALVVVASAALALAAAMTVDPVLLAVARLMTQPNVTFDQVLMREWAFAAGILLPMSLAFGAAFPLALAVASRDDESMVSDLGLVYTVNTTGAIVGALAAGFVLVPWLGLFDTIRIVVVWTALCGVGLAIAAQRRTGWLALGLGVATLAATSFVPAGMPASSRAAATNTPLRCEVPIS